MLDYIFRESINDSEKLLRLLSKSKYNTSKGFVGTIWFYFTGEVFQYTKYIKYAKYAKYDCILVVTVIFGLSANVTFIHELCDTF